MRQFFSYLWQRGSIEMICGLMLLTVAARISQPMVWAVLAAWVVWFAWNVYLFRKSKRV